MWKRSTNNTFTIPIVCRINGVLFLIRCRESIGRGPDASHATIQRHFELLGRRKARKAPAPGSGGANIEHERKQVKVLQLISAYRSRGHLMAKLDPLGLAERPRLPGFTVAIPRAE